MSYARQMLDTYPRAWTVDADVLAAAIDALSDCTQACHADNAADLSEQNGGSARLARVEGRSHSVSERIRSPISRAPTQHGR